MTAFDIDGLKRQQPYIGPHGNLSVAHKKYAVATAFGDGDTVDLIRLPRGAVIMEAQLKHSAFGSSVVADLGVVAVGSGAKTLADGLIDGGDVSSAGILRQSEVGVYADSDFNLDDDDYDVRLKLAGANPAAGTVEVTIFYKYAGTK